MIGASKAQLVGADGIAAPLRHATFRRIWLASVLSNLGILIQGVGAAWAMTQMGPAWQSSVGEQVPSETVPAALALNGISYNIARSIGPAIGGIVVAAAGAMAAFALNAMLYLPLIAALFLWKRVVEPSRLPP